MGIYDALLIASAGAAKGYRASEALKRELAEAKRKALLEEKELAIKESEAKSQNELRSSQAGLYGAQAEGLGVETEGKRRASSRASRPILPGGGQFKMNLLGQEIPLDTNEDLMANEDFIKELMGNISAERVVGLETGSRERINREDNSMRLTNPELFGGKSRTPETIEERRGKYLRDAISNPTIFEGDDEEAYKKRIRAAMAIFEEFDPEAFGKARPDSSKTGKSRNRGGLNLPSRQGK